MQDAKQMLRNKIIRFKKIYNFDFDHILIEDTVFVLIVKNVIKIKNNIFRTNSCDIETNVKKQNYSFQKDLQILILTIF